MSLETDKFVSFGTYEELHWFLAAFTYQSSIEKEELLSNFSRIHSVKNFNALIYLFEELNLIESSDSFINQKNSKFWKHINGNPNKLVDILVNTRVQDLKKSKILSSKYLTNQSGKMRLKGRMLPFRLSALKSFLITISALVKTNVEGEFLVSDPLSNLIVKFPEDYLGENYSQAELEESKELADKNKKRAGEIAEKWVVNYEKKRLIASGLDSKLLRKVKRISQTHAKAGFDIVSFESETSKSPDRFIEVKSFNIQPRHFFWTDNEITKAREFTENYFLYIVDRDQIEKENYNPIIVKNPFEEIFDGKELNKLSFTSQSGHNIYADGWKIEF